MQINKVAVITACLISILSGCATEYPCGEPSAGKCASVTDNYDRSFHPYTNPDDVAPPGFWGGSKDADKSAKDPINYFGFRKSSQMPASGSPLVSSPRMMRVWLTSYTDNDNIYHEQAYEYMLTDRSHWLYNNNRKSGFTTVKNVSLVQSSGMKNGDGHGSFDLSGANAPKVKPSNNSPSSLLGDFPAINALKNPSNSVTTTSVGSGIDKTSIIP